MHKRVFNIKTDEMGIDSENYIKTVYDSFIPKGKNTIATLKSAVSPWHKDLFGFAAGNNKGKSPYEMINDYVAEDIYGFYAKIIAGVDGQLKGCGERADKLRNRYRSDFEKSMQTTVRKITEEIENCAVMQTDSGIVMKRVNAVLEKRRAALQSLPETVYLQITRCVVLWKYEDDGYEEYAIIATGENCPVCSLMSGKKFLIKNLVPYENFPPFHPNCDCAAEILDKDGKTVLTLDSDGGFISENSGDLLEYAKFVLKKVVLGDFSDEAYTPDALALSIALGTSGLDIPMDVRDLAASIADISQNGFDKDNSLILALNLLALLPAVGAVKYADEAVGVAKYADDVGEAGNIGSKMIHNDILDSPRTGSALKSDDVSPIYEINEKTRSPQIAKEFPETAQSHGFNDIVDNYAGYATKTSLNNATLYQIDGSLNGVNGRFEWIIQDNQVTHRMFIQNGTMNGVPIKP